MRVAAFDATGPPVVGPSPNGKNWNPRGFAPLAGCVPLVYVRRPGHVGERPPRDCANDPVNRVDPTGRAWETVFDVISIGKSVYDLVTDPSWENAGYLLWDVGATVVPVVPGSYSAKLGAKAVGKADDVVDAAKGASKAAKVTKKAKKATTRRRAFRDAKKAAGIPKSAQYKTHKFVYDGSTANRTVFEFEVGRKKKYIVEHPFDKMGRGKHFHGADDLYGSPFNKGTYHQLPGHFPEDFDGFN